jgi:hypothetical protein
LSTSGQDGDFWRGERDAIFRRETGEEWGAYLGLFHLGIPQDMAVGLRKRLSLKTFVETGTHIGTTSYWASRQFDHVITIEANQALYDRSQKKLAGAHNVELLFGSSPIVLRSFVAKLERPALFWLDAHWSGPGTAGQDYQCPVLEEIVVVDSGEHQHIIMIDDARLFMNPLPSLLRPEAWPTLPVIIDHLRQRFPDAYLMVHADVIVRVPAESRDALETLMHNSVTSPLARINTAVKQGARKVRDALK